MTRPTILGAIRERVLLADGGMGTQLLEAGLEAGRAGAEWNITYPDRVRSVRSAYVAAGADILILVLDYYGTHKTPQVRAWLVKRPRFHVHFTPTYGSWLNQEERWFAELTNKQLRRGVHRSVRALETAIREFIDAHNANAKPFAWTKNADDVLASMKRFAQRTLDVQAAQ